MQLRTAWRHSGLHAFLVVVGVSLPGRLAAQTPYPSSPYGAYGSPYSSQYAQPYPQNNYAQPQYSAPQSYPQQSYADPQPYASSAVPYSDASDLASSAPAQALSAEQLEQLLAPIALYPDALLAQILAASTYPAQVAVADQWLEQMRAQGYGAPDQVAAGADAQSTWDPSVKALTAFPDVLDLMNRNLEWTTNLGNAYYNQPQDVMQTVQVLRDRAEQAGNLQSTPQEDVTQNQGYIDIAPPNPQIVYVPTYNPWDVYGQPIAPYSGFSLVGTLGNFFGSVPIRYGLGFAMSAFERTPWGLMAWGLDWLAHAVLFDRGTYYSHSSTVADWGLPHGGPRAYFGRENNGRWSNNGNFNRSSTQTWPERQQYSQRPDWQSNRNSAQSYVRPAIRAPYAPPSSEFNRSAQAPRSTYYTHPESPATQPQPAYTYRPQPSANPGLAFGYSNRPQSYPNRPPTFAARPQTFANPGNGYQYGSRPAQTYSERPNYAYASPYSSYRAPQFDSSRNYARPSYNSYSGMTAHDNRSSGFHFFGGEKEPKSFKAPKNSYKAPKGFGHEKGPKMSHSGGGGGHRHF